MAANPVGRGTRTTTGWGSGLRIVKPRQAIFKLYPHGGKFPLLGMSNMMKKSQRAPKAEFSWWTDALSVQGGAMVDVYDDANMSSATTAGVKAAGTLFYCKVLTTVAEEFKVGHTASLIVSTDERATLTGVVVGMEVVDATYTRITVKSRVATAATIAAGPEPSTADTIRVTGSAYSEGGESAIPVNYEPTKIYNYCQIFKTAYSVTGTQLAEDGLEIGMKGLAYDKKEKFEYHGIEIEKTTLFAGERLEAAGADGKIQRTTMGMFPMIRTYAPDNIRSYTRETAAAYVGKAWLTAGKDWVDNQLKDIFTNNSEVMMLGGIGVAFGMNQLNELYSTITVGPGENRMGLAFDTWITPYGKILFKTHPLMTLDTIWQNSAFVFNPDNIHPMVLRDTHSRKVTQGSANDSGTTEGELDEVKEEWLTEMGYEFHHPQTFFVLSGFGQNHAG